MGVWKTRAENLRLLKRKKSIALRKWILWRKWIKLKRTRFFLLVLFGIFLTLELQLKKKIIIYKNWKKHVFINFFFNKSIILLSHAQFNNIYLHNNEIIIFLFFLNKFFFSVYNFFCLLSFLNLDFCFFFNLNFFCNLEIFYFFFNCFFDKNFFTYILKILDVNIFTSNILPYMKFLLKIDVYCFLFLGRYLESFRWVKYHEYVSLHPKTMGNDNGLVRKLLIEPNYYRRTFFHNLLNDIYNFSLMKKCFIVYFAEFNFKEVYFNYEYTIQDNYHPVLFFLNLLFKSKIFLSFVGIELRRFFFNYVRFYVYYQVMQLFKFFFCERLSFSHFHSIHRGILSIDFDLIFVNTKLKSFFENRIFMIFFNNLFFSNYFFYFDFLFYLKSSYFFDLFVNHFVFFYEIINLIFFNYNEIFFRKLTLSVELEEHGDFYIYFFYFEDLFYKDLFQFYPIDLQFFCSFLDYYFWRLLNSDLFIHSTEKVLLINSNCDWVEYSKFFLYRKNFEYELNTFSIDLSFSILFFFLRDYFIKFMVYSYFLRFLFFFLFEQNNLFFYDYYFFTHLKEVSSLHFFNFYLKVNLNYYIDKETEYNGDESNFIDFSKIPKPLKNKKKPIIKLLKKKIKIVRKKKLIIKKKKYARENC